MVPPTLTSPPTPSTDTEPRPLLNRTILERWSAQLQAQLVSIHLKDDGSETHFIYLYQEHLADLKRELSDLRTEVLAIAADTSDPLMGTTQKQDNNLFDMSVKVKKLLFLNPSSTPSEFAAATPAAATVSRNVKLLKIDVPTFDGYSCWQTFWEQFSIAVDKRSDISSTEKLVYLRHSLKDGSAKTVIEGLSHSGDQYNEAIDSLKDHYDRPHIIHQTDVRKIYEVPSLKDGSGNELRRFHDTVQQHLRALKAMKEDPTGSFITALLELKLDKETMFEWQKASQDAKETPHCDDLLKFFNLRTQASETCSSEPKQHHPPKKAFPKSTTTFAASALDSVPNCSLLVCLSAVQVAFTQQDVVHCAIQQCMPQLPQTWSFLLELWE